MHRLALPCDCGRPTPIGQEAARRAPVGEVPS
jgi:hypothetical protein